MPTKLDLPASDRRVKVQLKSSENRAKELRAANFNACTFPDGTACTGAGKIIKSDGETKLICGNNCTMVSGRQRATEMTAEDAARCTKKKHHKTPSG